MHAGRLLCHRSSVLVRPRLETDLDECTDLARQVHDSDRYPIFLPSDLHSFMAAPDALAAWVAEDAGEIVGHVALRPRSSEVVMALAREVLGLPDGRLGVVARLLVSSRHRRRGIGSALLEVAAGEALARGLWPVLDVVVDHGDAVRLYESRGWLLAGRLTTCWGDNPEVEELVYLAPGTGEAGALIGSRP